MLGSQDCMTCLMKLSSFIEMYPTYIVTILVLRILKQHILLQSTYSFSMRQIGKVNYLMIYLCCARV